MDDNSLSNGTNEISPDQGHTLPILKKILDLSTKLKVILKLDSLFRETNKQHFISIYINFCHGFVAVRFLFCSLLFF